MAIYINRQAPQSGLASMLAHRGRMGDTELVHMTKPEVQRMMNSGLMSLNPQTGLPEYFLGDLFDFGKRFVKNIIKPKNLIPLVASIALPALAGPLFAGGGALAGLGSMLGPIGTNALLAGGGTFLGNLPFRSLEESAQAGLLTGGTQYGLGKLGQMMGPSDQALTEAGIGNITPAEFAKKQNQLAFDTTFTGRQGGFGETLQDYGGDFGESLSEVIAIPNTAGQAVGPGRMITPDNIPKEVFRLPRGAPVTVTGPSVVTPAELTSEFARVEKEAPHAFFEGSVNPEQQRRIARDYAVRENKLLTPMGAKPTRDMVGITSTPQERLIAQATNPYQPFYDAGGVKGGLAALKKFPVGEAVKTGLTAADMSQSVEDMTKQQEHQEKFLKELEKTGVPRPVALQRYQRAMARRQEREGETQEDILELYTQGGDRRFFDTATYRPVGTFTAAKGGLISLGHGGRPDFEGMVQGRGHGMEDNVIMDIKEKGGLLAVSPKEYVVPADVMAMIGNGNPDDGAEEMDSFISKFRQKKYGRDRQPPEMDGGRALQSLMKG